MIVNIPQTCIVIYGYSLRKLSLLIWRILGTAQTNVRKRTVCLAQVSAKLLNIHSISPPGDKNELVRTMSRNKELLIRN